MPAETPPADPGLLNRIAWSERWADRSKSVKYAQQALRTSQSGEGEKSKSDQGLAYRTLGWQSKWRGDFDAALTHCLKAEALLTEHDHPGPRGDIYSVLGVIHYSRNRLDLAGCATERGIHICCEQNSPETMVDLLTTRATIQRYSGDKVRAGMTLGRAREMASGAQSARVEHNIARWLHSDKEPEKGLALAQTSIKDAQTHHNRVVLPYAMEIAGACLVDLDRHDAAAKQFDEGLRIAIEDQDERAQCQIIRYHADMELTRGDAKRARDLYKYGSAIADGMAYPLWQKLFLLGLASAHEQLGDLKAALANHKAAWAIENEKRA